MRSLMGTKQNFVIGRALSAYGSSTNLTGTPINLYLDYNGAGPTSHSYPNATVAVSATAGTNFSAMAAPYYLTQSATSGSGRGMKVRCLTAAAATPWASATWKIVEQGSGYSSGNTITVIPTGVDDLTFTTAGTGYAVDPAVLPTDSTLGGQPSPGGLGLTVSVTAVDGGGGITDADIENPGYGYVTGDTVRVVGGGSNAVLTVTVTPGTSAVLTLSKAAIGCDALSFVHHTNRIVVSPMGLEVLN